MGHSRSLFHLFILIISLYNGKYVHYKITLMAEFQQRTSGTGSDLFAN